MGLSNQRPKRNTIPRFATEAEEAEWWYKQRDRLAKEAKAALARGELAPRRLPPSPVARASAKGVTVRLPEQDLARARGLAAKRGLSLCRSAVRRGEIGRACRRITSRLAFVVVRTVGLHRRAVCIVINGGRTVRAAGLFSGWRPDGERRQRRAAIGLRRRVITRGWRGVVNRRRV